MFDDFKSHQWIFFPVIIDRDILDDRSLPPEQVLPLCFQDTIRGGHHHNRATIAKVKFHQSCNNLVEVRSIRKHNAWATLRVKLRI